MKKTLLFAALFGIVLVAIAGFELNTVLNERVRILSSRTAGEVSLCNGVAMTEWLCFMDLGVRAEWPRLFWRWTMVGFSISTLLALIYIAAGLAGALIALLLHLTGRVAEREEWSMGGLPRILAGGGAGLLMYFLLLMLAGKLTDGAQITNYATREDLTRVEFFKGWILLPAAAGVFLTVFFDKLQEIFIALMDWLKGLVNK